MVIAAAILLAGEEISRAIHLHRDPNWETKLLDVIWSAILGGILLGEFTFYFLEPFLEYIYLYNG